MNINNSCQNINSDNYNVIDLQMKNKLTVLTINVRSLCGKHAELLTFLNSFAYSFMFICLTEICLDENNDAGFGIPNYVCFKKLRNNYGGGIFVYVLKGISVKLVDERTGIFSSHESVCLKSCLPNIGDFYLITIYRPPRLSKNEFLDYLDSTMEFFQSKKMCITGDFNLNLLNSNDAYIVQFCNIMSSFDMHCTIDKPTFTSNTTREPLSCLDHFWHNLNSSTHSFVIYPPFSDHLAIVLCVDCIVPVPQNFTEFRDFSYNNKTSFTEALELESEFYTVATNDVDIEIERFSNWVAHFLNRFFPLKRKVISFKSSTAPWLTSKIKRCINKKHKWFRLYKAGLITYRSFKLYCDRLKVLLKCAEAKYYERRFEKLKNNPTQNWNLLRDLLGIKCKTTCEKLVFNGNVYNEPFAIANIFVNYFATIPVDLVNNLPPSNIDGLSHITRNIHNFYLFHPSIHEVEGFIRGLKNTTSDKIFLSKVLKLGSNSFSVIIRDLLNLCIRQATFPDTFKIARVTPVYKKGCKEDVSNYRPISILNNLSRIFESFIQSRITSFLERYNLFSPDQYGFRRGMGTETACLRLITHILPAFVDKSYGAVLFLDFSRAFDTVQHEILTVKLDRLGVRGLPLEFIKSFLSSRSQYVELQNCKSALQSSSMGVPQGSSTGPLFFTVYINDLPSYLGSTCKSLLYADDTTICVIAENVHILETNLNECLRRVYEWCLFNRLSININKTEVVIFTNRDLDIAPQIKLNNVPIKVVDTFKYLGVFFDSHFKFNIHVTELCKKLSRYCGISFRLKNKLNLHTARTFYYAYFYSTVSYCIAAWGGLLICSHRGDKLCRLQDRMVKNLFSRYYPGLTLNELYIRINLLKLGDIYRLRLVILLYRMLKLGHFPEILSFINPTSGVHEHETRQSNQFRLPFPRVECIRESFVYQILSAWNGLASEIKSLESLVQFKSACHKFYLNKY